MFKILQKAIKYRYLLSWLIAFFIGGILYSFTCHAQAMPTPSSTTFSVIEGGNNSLFSSGFSSIDVFPYSTNPTVVSNVITTAYGDPLLLGTQLNLVDSTQYDVRSLTSDEITTNSSIYSYLYDVNGNIVYWDDVYFVHYDNGFCHGELYVDSNGDILTSDIDNTYSMFQLGYGGYILGVTDLANIYDQISDILNDQQLNFSLNGTDLSNTDLCLYYMLGRKYRDSVGIATVFIPNAYTSNVLAINTGNIYSNGSRTWLSMSGNDTSLTPYNTYWGSYTQYGKSYDCLTDMQTNFNNATVTDYYTMTHGNVGNSWVYYLVDYNGWTFNSSLATSLQNDEIVSFKKLDVPSNTKIIQINDDSYDYNSISELEQNLNSIPSERNELFDKSSTIDETNYPLNYPYSGSEIDSSTLPFPSQGSVIEPAVDPILDYGVVTQPSNQSILDSFSNLQIPFLQNIRYRFPFCIPWDIRDAISLLKFSPTAPAWDFDWKITVLGTTYKYHCVGDLSDFDDLAILFRRLMLCAVFIGLAFWTYKLLL